MSDYSELKRIAESLPQLPWSYEANGFILAWDGTERSRCENVGGFYYVCEGVSNFREYLLALEPAKVLALIAENEQSLLGSKILGDHLAKVVAERDQLKAENEALCSRIASMSVSGFGEAFYLVAERLGVTGRAPVSPMQVFTSEVLPALDKAIKDAERYRWLRDKSEAVHNFYISVPLWFKNVTVERESVDAYIDSAISQESTHD